MATMARVLVKTATILLLSTHLPVLLAQTIPLGSACNIGRNRITSTSHQFLSDCEAQAYCDPASLTCKAKTCRNEEFPFKFPNTTAHENLPPFCGPGTFCPDEEDQCMPLQPVGTNCQMDRDDQCEHAPNAAELASPWNRQGAICLHFTCYWQNATLGNPCINDNQVYINFRTDGSEFANIVSRDNCQTSAGLFCDGVDNTCKKAFDLGGACNSDKQCLSHNCGSSNTCVLPAGTIVPIPLWQYILTGVGIIVFILGILTGLFLLHRRNRAKTQREIREYFHEQTTYRSSIIALHTAARERTASLYSRSESRLSQYDEHGQLIYRDDDSQRHLLDGSKRHSRLRDSMVFDEDEDEERQQARGLLGAAGYASRDSFSQSRLSLDQQVTPRQSYDYGQAGGSGAGGGAYAAVPLRGSMDMPRKPGEGPFNDPWEKK